MVNQAIDLTSDDNRQRRHYDRDALVVELTLLTEEIEIRQRRVAEIQDILHEIDRAEQTRQQQLVTEQFIGQQSSSATYAWSEMLDQLRTNVFGISCWRPMQKEICDCALSGNDCMVFLPAGSGKSLCFQLPALISQGRLTLVISPLVALMHDQVTQLQQLRIRAAKMTKDTPSNVVESIYADIVAGALSLLYVSPELLSKSKRLQSTLSKISASGKLSRVAIDEAHCCSQWGHDFRPDYRALGIIRKLCPDTGITALTATADENTANDVKKILSLSPRTVVFRQSCDRPNLCYEVRLKPSSAAALIKEIADLITGRFANQSGIIYALSKKDCETICEQLQELGVACASYHAGFDSDVKDGVYELWQNNQVQVVVATIAFGMGVSKPDVRFVIHQSLSKSLSGYYQESGRAGRDRKDAACILYYSPQDALRLVAMGVESHNSELHLIDMLRYCQDLRTCRHIQIERHFSEKTLTSCCQQYCDNCTRDQYLSEKRDVSIPVKAMLQEFKKADLAMTVQQLSDGWRGIGSAEYKLPSHAQLDKKRFTKNDAQRIIVHLIITGYLSFSYVANAYSVQAYVKYGVNNIPVPSPFNVTFLADAKSKKLKNSELKSTQNSKERKTTAAINAKYAPLPANAGNGFVKRANSEIGHQPNLPASVSAGNDSNAEIIENNQRLGADPTTDYQYLSEFPELGDSDFQFSENNYSIDAYREAIPEAVHDPNPDSRAKLCRPNLGVLDLTGDDDDCTVFVKPEKRIQEEIELSPRRRNKNPRFFSQDCSKNKVREELRTHGGSFDSNGKERPNDGVTPFKKRNGDPNRTKSSSKMHLEAPRGKRPKPSICPRSNSSSPSSLLSQSDSDFESS